MVGTLPSEIYFFFSIRNRSVVGTLSCEIFVIFFNLKQVWWLFVKAFSKFNSLKEEVLKCAGKINR